MPKCQMFPDHDMAHIIRWMKSKLYGYKPFAVMPNDMGENRLSDTEVLLKQSTYASEESFTSDPRQRRSVSSSKESVKSNNEPVKRSLHLEELECDVSVKNCGSNRKGSQRQEFSFTLYDVDGHGKITKDDIAGLVKTIYETLGQSIKVPHYGSKTIKVKLTVSPEKKTTTCKGGGEETSSSTLTTTAKLRNNTATIGAVPNQTTRRWSNDLNYLKSRERRYRQENKLRRRHSISSSGLSEDREADVSENDDDEVPLNNKLNNLATMTPCRSNIYSKYKKRSSSLQRQELLQIIQANMKKNNLCFQTSRKPTTNNTSSLPNHRHRAKLQPPTCHYVNSWENPTIELTENCVHHQRSQHLYDIPTNNSNPCSMQQRNGDGRKQPSSHELKHRYRELEQARAKEQVVRWLEQEFAMPFKYSNKSKINNVNNFKTTTTTPPKDEIKAKNRICSNEKHKHHYIHEHVHHHYHHYTESPIVV